MLMLLDIIRDQKMNGSSGNKKHLIFVLTAVLVLMLSSHINSEVFHGKVIDSESQLPVAYCNVRIRDINGGGMTLQDGTFSISGFEPGLFVYEAGRPSTECLSVDTFRIEENEDTYLVILLEYCGISRIWNTTLAENLLCEVHNIDMFIDTVFVGHHFKPLGGVDDEIYSSAEESQFPNAHAWYFYGKRDDDQIYIEPQWRYARVLRCPECIKARNKWLDNNVHIKSRLPY